jgi:hypothetical protein
MSAREPKPDRAGEEEGRKPFLLRLPAPLLADLRRWADEDLRSLNGHLEYVLREAVKRHKREGPPK